MSYGSDTWYMGREELKKYACVWQIFICIINSGPLMNFSKWAPN